MKGCKDCPALNLCMDAAQTLENLQIELKAMRGAANSYKAENATLQAELEKVKAERDAAVADVNAIIGDVEEIRRGYGVDNADADDAFAGLCESYCAHNGHGCYKEGSDGYYCANFKWRGPQKEDGHGLQETCRRFTFWMR